jgi:hypothetical protein
VWTGVTRDTRPIAAFWRTELLRCTSPDVTLAM